MCAAFKPRSLSPCLASRRYICASVATRIHHHGGVVHVGPPLPFWGQTIQERTVRIFQPPTHPSSPTQSTTLAIAVRRVRSTGMQDVGLCKQPMHIHIFDGEWSSECRRGLLWVHNQPFDCDKGVIMGRLPAKVARDLHGRGARMHA